jgi:hypothetical protein
MILPSNVRQQYLWNDRIALLQQKKTTFRKLDLFPTSGEVAETPILLRPLETANFNHLHLLPLTEDGKKPSFENVVFPSTYLEFRKMVLLGVKHHRHSPLELQIANCS